MFILFRQFFNNYRLRSIARFLDWYFHEPLKSKLVIQVGANDGVQSDPLRRFLGVPGDYQAILIEPIPFYVSKLKVLYQNRSDIQIIQAACGKTNQVKKLFFIDPDIADEMNGDGPQNNWAHGQGSFDRDTVIYWIKENSFRGATYRDKIPLFISSIRSIELNIQPVMNLLGAHLNQLLVIDVQGFELEVLEGIDWESNPPAHILLEDDLGNTSEITQFLLKKGFRYICGDNDKVFSRTL